MNYSIKINKIFKMETRLYSLWILSKFLPKDMVNVIVNYAYEDINNHKRKSREYRDIIKKGMDYRYQTMKKFRKIMEEKILDYIPIRLLFLNTDDDFKRYYYYGGVYTNIGGRLENNIYEKHKTHLYNNDCVFCIFGEYCRGNVYQVTKNEWSRPFDEGRIGVCTLRELEITYIRDKIN